MSNNITLSLRAGADISASQFRAVILDDEFQVAVVTNANAPQHAIGILQNDPDAAGRPAEVLYAGQGKAQIGGTVSAGDHLAYNNSGQLIADAEAPTAATIDLHHIATALEGGASGDTIQVVVKPAQLVGAE